MANINLSGSISTTGTSILGSFNVVFASDSDADHVLTVTEYTNNFLNVTSGVSLTTTKNLIAPLVAGQGFVIQNNTTGGQSITVKGVTGTGFTIANGTTSGVICDGTNYLQIGGAISGAAGGQLSGNYPNPIVISTTPIYVNGLHAITPLAPHISILVDGYSSNNDGGGGSFFWNINYTGPSNPLNIIPDGYASPGAWSRVIGTDHVIEATWFGAKGDMHRDVSNNLIGTDDTAAIQAMLDFNNFTADADTAGNWTTNQFQYICKLSATNIKYQTFLVQARTCYRITEPLQINDFWASYNGHNTTTSFIGEPLAQSGLYHQEFLGPAIVSGNYGINPPFITLDPNGSGEYLVQFGQGISTTIASGSNGQTLPQSIVYVASTAGFPHAGTFTTGGIQVAYTGITSNTFTGCTIVTAFVVPVPMTTGDAVATASAPTYCFSDYSTGDLQGWTNFTFECFLNPGDSAAWMQSAYPSSFSSSWFGCGGNIGTVKNHRTMHLQQNNIFGFPFLQFNLTTANGTFIVSTSGSVDHTFTPNTLNHFAVTYDGSHLRMFVNGLQPDASMTVAATGALAQQWYESLSVLSGLNESWPFQGGTGIQQPGPAGMLMGKIRFSNIARYTAPFAVPAPSTVVCDTNTRILLGFSPDFVPTRNSLQNYAIAQSGQGLKGKILPDGYGFPVWLRSYCNGLSYVGGTRIKDMFFAGAGEAIRLTTCTDSTVGENCFILGTESGIIFDSFSYNSGVGPNVTFWQCGLPTINANCFSAEIFFGGGSQFSYIGDGMSSGFGSCNWSVVSVFADLKMGTCFPNSYHQGTYAFVQNVSTILMDGTTMLDDTSSGFAMCGCLFAPTSGAGEARLTWHGGYIGMEDSNNVPVFIIGSDSPVNIDTTIFVSTCPVFSFQGAGTTTKTPAILSGSTSAGTAIIDPVFPGPVIVPQLSQYPRFVSQLSSFWLGAPASLPTRAVIQVDGYTTVGDGGEGTFFWNAYYTGPSTPLNVVPDGYVTGAWVRDSQNGWLNVKWWGAKGDATTDDSAAIQAAIDYASTANLTQGATVYLPMGNYRITTPLFLWAGNVSLIGDANTGEYSPFAPVGGSALLPSASAPCVVLGTNFEAAYAVDNSITILPMVASNAGALENMHLRISESDVASINGLTALTTEFWVKPKNVWTGQDPSIVLNSGGARQSNYADTASAITIYLDDQVGDGYGRVYTTLTTSTGALSNHSNALSFTALQHVAVVYDGTNLKTYVNGTLSGTTASGSAGHLVQTNYETMSIGLSNAAGYPTAVTSQTVSTAHPYDLGPFRMCDHALYTTTFSPPSAPLGLSGTGQTILVLNWDAAYRGATFNPRALGYVVGQTNFNHGAIVRPTQSVWLRIHGLIGTTYVNNQKVQNLTFNGSQDGIYTYCALYFNIEHCTFFGYRGVTLDAFSYGGAVMNCGFNGQAGDTNYAWSWGLMIGIGTQFTKVSQCNFSANNAYQWCLITEDGGLFDTLYMVGGLQGFIYNNGVSGFSTSCTFNEVYCYDDGQAVGTCGAWINTCYNLTWNGGACETDLTTPTQGLSAFILDNCHHASIHCSAQGSLDGYVFKFPTLSANPVFSTVDQALGVNNQQWIDPSGFFGPLVVEDALPTLTVVDLSSLTAHNGDGYLIGTNNFMFGKVKITNTGPTITGNTKVYLPSVLPNYLRVWLNGTAFTLTFVGLSGSGIAVANGKSAQLMGDGTNIIRLTPDT